MSERREGERAGKGEGKGKASQLELDHAFLPQVFEVEVRYAQVLNTVFSVMFFCSGMPILLVVGAVDLLLLFAADKWYFYNVYHKPPQLGPDLSKALTSVLPIAAFLHLIMACWTFAPEWVQVRSQAIKKIYDRTLFYVSVCL